LWVIAPPSSRIFRTVFDDGGRFTSLIVCMLTLLTY
jgi:hypothetical protein